MSRNRQGICRSLDALALHRILLRGHLLAAGK
jgi:hypothetical protein